MTRRPDWNSGPDGVAHLVAGGARFALCGARADPPRYYRGDPRCVTCQQLEEARTTKPTT